MHKALRVSAIIPAVNEQGAIAKVVSCLFDIKNDDKSHVIDHVIVCDNGSTDLTAEKARDAGATVVYEAVPGYGNACLKGISALPECDVVLFVDGDDSCYPEQALRLLEGMYGGDDLAIGSRVLGSMEAHALTPVQRFGNHLSAFIIRLLWRKKITDLGPFRAVRKKVLDKINMEDKTFGWTVEMQVKAIQHGFTVKEYPVDSKVRIGQSKISGTVKGSILAGVGILSMIAKLWWQEQRGNKSVKA